MRIALYQPDIPQNVGAMIRLCACTDVGLDVIEPTSFPWDDRKIRQSAMDYIDKLDIVRHSSWAVFLSAYSSSRIILMTTKSVEPYTAFEFRDDDILLAGSESAGVPSNIHEVAAARVCIPMKDGLRSLNIVNATSMILGEAIRQVRT